MNRATKVIVSYLHINFQNPVKKREHPAATDGNDGPVRKRSRLEAATN